MKKENKSAKETKDVEKVKMEAMQEETAVIEKVIGEVVSSCFNSDELQGYQCGCDKIMHEINSVESSYLTIAMELYTIYKKKLYQIDNYPNIYDMAYDKFSLGRATCNNYINICEKYGVIDEAAQTCKGLLPEYEKFSSSKLVAMLGMPEKLQKEIRPEMSVREIRRKRQIYEEKLPDSPSDSRKKARKKKKIELLKTVDIKEVTGANKELLLGKVQTFMQEHPEVKYDIAVTLVYEE